MNHDTPAYGLWSLVVINAAIFILFAFSFFKTLVMFPILVTVYVRLAHREEREVRQAFGRVWDEYAARTPRFIPRRRRRSVSGESSARA